MLTIGKAAQQSGVSVDTIRFYERCGLLAKPPRTPAKYRLYDGATVARLRFIRRAKALGFSLDEIQELLFLNDGQGTRTAVRHMGEKRLAEITHKIAELERMRRTLSHLIHECDGHGPLSGCPIIEAMLSDDSDAAQPRTEWSRTAAPRKKSRQTK